MKLPQNQASTPCCGPDGHPIPGLDRRRFLRLTLGAMAALTLPVDLALAQPRQVLDPSQPLARAMILLWLEGGPSHIDTFDPKPGNGLFQVIPTRIPGVQISEHFPRVAEVSDRLAIVRSVNSAEGNHSRARYLAHTGYAPTPTMAHPSLGSIVSEQIGESQAELPNFVSIGGPSVGPGYAGVQNGPFVVQNPTQPIQNLDPPRNVTPVRFDARLALSEQLDQAFRARHPGDRQIDAFESVRDKAVRFMRSDLRTAFDLEQETQATRASYGEGQFGQGALMARRLIEAGVPFVEVSLRGWDTHRDNFTEVARLSAELDAALCALILDLGQRDLLNHVLVASMGEFGRTPRINANEGRDHWPRAWSALFAGGGVRGGQAIGVTDAEGAEVVEGRVGVPDLMASCCHALGIDHRQWRPTPAGRPMQLVDNGQVIERLFA
jgi:hypothetical protein